MTEKRQLSFSGGELAPALHARADLQSYASGAKTLLNTIVLRHGGTANRPGTVFVAPTVHPLRTSRTIPFVFNRDQSYVLEFGHLYIKVIKSGDYIKESAKNILDATSSTPVVLEVTAHGYSTGDQVYIEGVGGMTELNGNIYTITVVDVDHFSLDGTTGGAGTPLLDQDLHGSEWTETDTSGAIETSAGPPSRVTITASSRGTNSEWMSKDYGVDQITGDFRYDFTYHVTGADTYGHMGVLLLSDSLTDYYSLKSVMNADYMGVRFFNSGLDGPLIRLEVQEDAIHRREDFLHALNTTYYGRLTGDSSIGSFGDIRLKMYETEADRDNDENEVSNARIILDKALAFRYTQVAPGWDQGASYDPYTATGYIERVKSTMDPGGGGSAYTSGGTAQRIYALATGYPEADLATLNYTQSADVLTINHPHHPTKDITRVADDSWTINTLSIAASISLPTNLASDAGGTTYYYQVTAVDAETSEESLPSSEVGSSSETSELSWDAVTGAGQYNVYKKLNGVFGFIGVAGAIANPVFSDDTYVADTLDTPPEDRQPFALGDADTITAISQADPCVVTIGAGHSYAVGDLVWLVGGDMVEIDEEINTFYVSAINGNDFTVADPHTLVDIDSTAYTAYTTGGTAQLAHNFPATSAYFQQRLLFGYKRTDTEIVLGSKSGLRQNFMVSTPLQDDDAVTFSMVGREVNAIKHLLDVGELIIFTASGEWKVEGDSAGTLTPGSIHPVQQTGHGCSDLRPLMVDGSAIYVQARGSVVRDLGYEYESNGYKGSELSIFAAHLFEGYTIVDWAYQQTPHSIVWAVRSDGVLLGMTYIREHLITAWHQHTFGGGVESVCVIPEGDDDVLYMTVRRTIQGNTKRYIEKMTPRYISDITEAVFMDSSLSYDGRHTGTTTMVLSGGVSWGNDEILTLTASAAAFVSTDVGNQYWLIKDDETVRCTVTAFTSTTIISISPNRTVPDDMQDSIISTWSKAVDTLIGLGHLNGEAVSVLGDGFVVANPNDPSYVTVTVEDASITLEKPHVRIHVGVPYISDLVTLDMDKAEGLHSLNQAKAHQWCGCTPGKLQGRMGRTGRRQPDGV